MFDPGTLYVDPILTGFSVGYEDQTLHGEEIAPVTPVNTQSGKYLVFDRSAWLIYDSRREPGTVANEIQGAKWSTDSFETQEHSLQAPVLDEERQQLQSLGGLGVAGLNQGAEELDLDPEQAATEAVTRSLLLEHELKIANAARNTANYAAGHSATLAGTSQWDDQAFVTAGDTYSIVSDPVADIQAAIRVIYADTGRYPNLMMIPRLGAAYIENHPRITKRFENFSLTNPNAFNLLSGFQGRVVLTESVYNAANNIDAAENMTSFWGKDVILAVVDPTPGQKTKTFMKTFAQVYPDGTTRPTDRWREIQRKADLVRTSYKYDFKIVSNVAGYILKTAFSAGAW